MEYRLDDLQWLMTPGAPVVDFEYLVGRPNWHRHAACRGRGTELSFRPGKNIDMRPARIVCGGCNVKSQCLEAPLADPDTKGIWAGTSEHQRQELRRERNGA